MDSRGILVVETFEFELEKAKPKPAEQMQMQDAFLFAGFTFRGFHSSHFLPHFWSPFHSLFVDSSAKLAKSKQKSVQKGAEK